MQDGKECSLSSWDCNLGSRDYILVSSKKGDCLMCGHGTNYVDMLSEGRFCSAVCLKEFYEYVAVQETQADDFF